MPLPSVSHWTCAVPKAGGEAGDYEDAAAVATESWPVCAAVTDGATESVFAKGWAERLAQGIVDTGATTPEAIRNALPEWQSEWREAVRSRTTDRPWYVAAKAAEGAFAAVLGLSLHADGGWRAVSVGDCCLFHVRGEECLKSWPFGTPDAFTNRPALVPSRSEQDVPSPETITGTWRPTDRFVLATDAVATWFLKEGLPMGARLREDALPEAIKAARADGSLRNDDATVLVLDLAASPEASDGAPACS